MRSFKLQLKNQNSEQQVYEYAMFLLNIRLRTEGELIDKMKGKNYNKEIIFNVISKLKNLRYVDDRRFAEIFLENLKKYKTFGYFGIKKKLMEKKLPLDIIDRLLSDNLNEREEFKIAERFLKKEGYAAKNKAPENEDVVYGKFGKEYGNTEKQKLANKLKSRGFRSGVIAMLLF